MKPEPFQEPDRLAHAEQYRRDYEKDGVGYDRLPIPRLHATIEMLLHKMTQYAAALIRLTSSDIGTKYGLLPSCEKCGGYGEERLATSPDFEIDNPETIKHNPDCEVMTAIKAIQCP